jgi:predicted DNA-binding protein
MSKKQMVAFRLDKAVVELLKKLAEETGKSQAALVREMILKEVYK